MAFGIYVHIPHCLQICPYCDFTKYESGKIMPPERYVELLGDELLLRAGDVPKNEVSTIYFGGGTPSLFDPPLILTVLDLLAKAGFRKAKDAEITLEINPATIDQGKLEAYGALGVNRFSVGAQTFNDRLLKVAGRKHSSRDTIETLSLLKRNRVNYSFDLLFALPTQSLEEVRADVATALAFDPTHLSAYCLTVHDDHPMAVGRAPEEVQIEMFHVIESTLAKTGIMRYEISNFARPGGESRHNMLYWTDQPYWGIGVSAHSYFPPGFASDPHPSLSRWGTRFWNPPALNLYEKQIRTSLSSAATGARYPHDLPERQREELKMNQALTDFCHTSLRLVRGLDENALRLKFGESVRSRVAFNMDALQRSGHVIKTRVGWSLSERGRLAANMVFEKLTFLENEFASV